MEKRKLSAKDGSTAFVVGFLLCQLAVIFLYIIGSIVAKFLGVETEVFADFLTDQNNYGYLLCMLALDLTLIFYAKYKNKNTDNKIWQKPNGKKCLIYVGLAILTFILVCPATLSFDVLLQKWGVPTKEFTPNLKGYLLGLFSLVLLPAVGEELLLRGVVFKSFKQYGFAFSVVMSAVMFMMFHTSLYQLIFPICFGLVFGVVMYKENNIFYTILMHAVNNFLALSVSYFKLPLFVNHWLYYVVAVVLLIAFLTTLIIYIKKQNAKNPKQKLEKSEIITLILAISLMLAIYIAYNLIA